MKGKLALAFCGVAGMLGGAAALAGDEMSEKVAAKLAGFESTGETTSCLSITHIRTMDALDDWRFLVRASGGDYYLNETGSRCHGAARANNYIQYKMSGNQLCRNQIITIVDQTSGMTVGSCGLGSFEKLEKAPAE
jgi:hypothetical protein